MYLIKLTVKNSHSHKHTVVEFGSGLNWLLGENEGGKTELLDLLGYAITGQGLRTSVADAKGLEVDLYFRIKNTVYRVVRAKTVALYEVIYENGTVKEERITAGKTATNSAIVSRLGYDYSVYSKLNYSQQLEGTALTSAKTSERLSLINKINGVDEANAFEKLLESQRKDLKSQLKALDRESILDSVSFEVDSELEELASNNTLEGLSQKSVEIYDKLKELNTLSAHYNSLDDVPVVNTPFSLEQLFIKYQPDSLKQFLRDRAQTLGTKENLEATLETLLKQEEDLIKRTPSKLVEEDILNLYVEVTRENENYYKQEAVIAEHLITCPACEHTFTDEGMQNPFTLRELPVTPDVYKENREYVLNVKHKLVLTQTRISDAKITLEAINKELLEESSLSTKEAVLAVQSDLDGYLESVRTKSLAENKLKAFLENFKVSPESFPLIVESIATIPTLEEELSHTSKLKDKLALYISQKSAYELAVKTQRGIDESVALLKDKLVVIEKVLEESKKIRLEIQNNCIPVLNNLASKMINKLTGGKRFGLTMNEKFELSLDGKPINCYSGSTIVLANVAFRVALIDMFFKKNFPVFIGDEIDAYADDDRSLHIHDALVRLEKEGYQMILVSHNKALPFTGTKIQLSDIKNKG